MDTTHACATRRETAPEATGSAVPERRQVVPALRRVYPLEDYHRNRTCPDGRRYVCKWCRYREYQARKQAGFLGPRRMVTETDGVTT